jgi:CRISPR-associated protein (TIGR02584 family)
MQGVIIVAELGPNSAPLSELIWALFRQQDRCVEEVFLLVNPRTLGWFQREFLGRHGALEQLHAVLGEAIVDRECIHTMTVGEPEAPLKDDEQQTDMWNAARWMLYRHAIKAAGERPVVFGLIGGSHRTRAATTAVMFQLLARPRDLCLDVRVDREEVKGGTGFYFPEQPRPLWGRAAGIRPSDVTVSLVHLDLPRLRGLLPPESRGGWLETLAATQSALREAERPRLHIDLIAEEAWVNDARLPLSLSQLIWLAVLARARKQGEGWVDVSDHEPLRGVLQQIQPGVTWEKQSHNQALVALREPDGDPDEAALRTLRSQTKRRLVQLCQKIPHGALLVPEIRTVSCNGKQTQQRLPLEGERISVRSRS